MNAGQIEQWLQHSQALQGLPAEVLAEIRSFAEGQVARIQELVKIGMALSAEKNLDRLLEMIVSEARRFTHADGGTLYIKNDRDELEFMIVQNDSLGIRMGGTGERISWPPVLRRDSSGVENHRNVSAHCSLLGEPVNIVDVYGADFDFQGTRDFDARTGYRSKSMLLVPMRNHEDEVIGVLQLLNARQPESGETVAFPDHEIADITSLASQAALAITNVRLVKELEHLLDAFLRSIAAAIDEKSPYTGGHVANVAELTVRLAEAINRADSGPFAEVCFSEDELGELRMAAWMHDIGKVTTPEYVVDKATKLQTIYDRIEVVKTRLEVLKRDAAIASSSGDGAGACDLARYTAMAEFLEQVNAGGEFLADDQIEKIREIGRLEFEMNGERRPLLSAEEIENLSIRRGTLTGAERGIINNHVTLTIKMLEELPFPLKLRRVPEIAGMHHEKLDGSGYPRGISAEKIPLQARILAVADVFEALTAADRPYSHGKKLSEAMRIIGFMCKDKHLDEELCDLLVRSGLVSEYCGEKLTERQRDFLEWRGEKLELQG
ncbi:MAG: GAF domain-containing protein [Desulfobulbaceae bacterium]|nr:GAF domain-containing protein [Desulfobulbaceae bacterium]